MADKKSSRVRRARSSGAVARAPSTHLAALLDVAADFYWEQDAAYRFTVWRPTRSCPPHEPFAGEVIGKSSAELCPPPGRDTEHWVRHRAVLDARESFRDVAHTWASGDGRIRNFSLSGAAAFAANGEFIGDSHVAGASNVNDSKWVSLGCETPSRRAACV